MSLLGALARHAAPVNLKQLAGETSLHPSTAHRILGVMVENRLVDRIEPGTYRLGIRLLEFGNLVKSRISVRQEALPYMQSLHQELVETINLSVMHEDGPVRGDGPYGPGTPFDSQEESRIPLPSAIAL